MQFLILGLLIGGPLSAYDLRKQFTAGISLFYSASLGGIQRALGIAESRGWARKQDVATGGRTKHVYEITDAGRAAFTEWMHAPITESDAEQSILAKVYLLSNIPEHERETVLAALRTRAGDDLDQLSALKADLGASTVPEHLHDAARYRRATLDYGIRAHEVMVHWLREVDPQ